MSKTPELENASANLIQNGTAIKGDINTTGNIRIDGKLIGELVCKGKLILGKTGEIEGTVTCNNAEIEGTLTANMHVAGLLSLKSSAKLFGEVVVNKLAIEAGAIFSGTCKMDGSKDVVKNGKN